MLENVGVALGLAFATETLVEHFVGAPMEKALPEVDRFWLRYVSLVIGGAASYFSELNIIVDSLDETVSLLLTAALVGGGTEVIHRLVNFVRKKPNGPDPWSQ